MSHDWTKRIPAIEGKLDAIYNALYHIIRKEYSIMALLDQLVIDVQENKSAVDSAVTLLQGLKAKLDAAGTDAVKLAELGATLDAQTVALSEAVVANTPAEPVPPVTP